MSETELHQKLAAEMGEISWSELQRHFARGVLIAVAADLDLVEVAARIAGDDTGALREWMDSGRVARATDEHARRWEAAGQAFEAVVVAPWVLAREIEQPGSTPA